MAQDINGNTDADYAGNVSFGYPNGNTAGFATANLPSGAFTAGIKSYPANFNFTTGNSNTQLAIGGSVPAMERGGFHGSALTEYFSGFIFQITGLCTMAPRYSYINFHPTNIDQTAINTGNAFIIEQFGFVGRCRWVVETLMGTQLTDITFRRNKPAGD